MFDQIVKLVKEHLESGPAVANAVPGDQKRQFRRNCQSYH
jgi:hypothetical protein